MPSGAKLNLIGILNRTCCIGRSHAWVRGCAQNNACDEAPQRQAPHARIDSARDAVGEYHFLEPIPTHPRGTCSMPIQFTCPGCAKKFQVPDELVGKRLRCKGCSAVTTVPMEAEIVDDAPAVASVPRAEPSADDGVIVAEVVEPRRGRERGPRRKRSALKVILIVGLIGGLLACLVGAGGTAVWYFGIRDRGLAGDMKYMPDYFSHLQVVNYDVVKSAPAFEKAQNCPGAKNRFTFVKTPDGKTLDVTHAMIASSPVETVTLLRLRNN